MKKEKETKKNTLRGSALSVPQRFIGFILYSMCIIIIIILLSVRGFTSAIVGIKRVYRRNNKSLF